MKRATYAKVVLTGARRNQARYNHETARKVVCFHLAAIEVDGLIKLRRTTGKYVVTRSEDSFDDS